MTLARGKIDRRMSGYVGQGSVRNSSGVMVWTTWPMSCSSRVVDFSVRTTPLTCGSQASVTSAIFIN